MMPIETWGRFKLGDLFTVEKGSRLTKANRIDGRTPYVGASQVNNGVTQYIGNDEHLHDGHCLTVCYNGAPGTTFYQPDPFWATDDVNVLVPKRDMSREILLFMAPIIEHIGRQNYTYTDKWRQDIMKEELLPLPQDANGEPDWRYMDDFMSAMFNQAHTELASLGRVKPTRRSCDTSAWHSFKIGDLFELKKGTRLTKANMRPGNIPFIGAANINNGVTAHIANDEHIHPSGTLTVAYNGNGGTGKTFYQPEPFWASDDVHVLYPRCDMTIGVALFIASAIEEVGRNKYGFTDKWKLEYMRNDEIMLPVTDAGTPDRQYMDTYISYVIDSTSASIDAMASLK